MRLTEKLKSHVIAKGWAAAGASDDEVRTAVSQRLQSGDLPASEFAGLTSEKRPSPKAMLEDIIEKAVQKATSGNYNPQAGLSLDSNPNRGGEVKSPNPNAVFGQAAKEFADPSIRVKSAAEQYANTRTELRYPERTGLGRKHFFAGQRVKRVVDNKPMDDLSEQDKAIAGAWFKLSIWKNSDRHLLTPTLKPTEHEMDLIRYAVEHREWSGPLGFEPANEDNDERVYIKGHKLAAAQQEFLWRKMLLDDSTSGGLNITPQVFDDAIILTPVLYGELYPFVNVTPVTRGRRVLGGAMANPTVSWGTAEGTNITPFTTTGFISAFNNTIYPAVGAVQLGLDFLEDTPVQVGQTLVDRFGIVMMQQLDIVISVGDGVTQPTGIFTAAGTTSVTCDNNLNGPPTVGDYEALLFSVPKQYRQEPNARGVFLANETSYQRARGIQVNQTDQRRVFGLNETDYMLLGQPYKINGSVANNQIAYAMLNRYRLYKRLGMIARIETAGYTLALGNTKLIVVRARFGGSIELGAAASITSTAQN